MRVLAALSLVFALAACGPASVSGQVSGETMDSSDAIASTSTIIGIETLSVVIGGDTGDLCADLSKGIVHKGATLLELGIVAKGLQKIQYVVGSNSALVTAHASKLDTGCGDILKKNANGGTITLTKLDGDTIEGSFDLTFEGSDELTGSFSARLCSSTNISADSCI